MGRPKKSDKALKSDAVDGDKEGEPYQCTGHFQTDLHELCTTELQLYKEIPVVPRPKRPSSPSHAEPNVVTSKKGKDDKKNQQVEIVEEETPEEKEAMELLGFKPKTFILKNHYDLLKPVIQVEMDNPDKQDTVTEVFIRSWKLESPLLSILGKCFAKMQRLHTLTLWRSGLTSTVIRDLGKVLVQVENIKYLNLESNDAVEDENYCDLIREDSPLQKLNLRFNNITSKGAALLAEQLGNTTSSNTKLICLDLSCNKIGDDGAVGLSQGLRTNRTLLALSLCSNEIGDRGATALAHVCSRFFLTHEEIQQRRKMLSIDRRTSGSPDRESKQSRPPSSIHTPPPSRKGADRPASTRSTDKDKKTGRDSKLAKTKKDEKAKVEEKGKGKSAAVKEDAKIKGGKAGDKGDKSTSDIKGSAGKTPTKGTARGNRVKMTTPLPDTEPDVPVAADHPFLERTELIDGSKLLIPGNYVLAMLNLSRNNIANTGVDQWRTAMAYQTAYMNQHAVIGTGLMKLMISGNTFSEEYENYKLLDDIMQGKDPLHSTVDKD